MCHTSESINFSPRQADGRQPEGNAPVPAVEGAPGIRRRRDSGAVPCWTEPEQF